MDEVAWKLLFLLPRMILGPFAKGGKCNRAFNLLMTNFSTSNGLISFTCHGIQTQKRAISTELMPREQLIKERFEHIMVLINGQPIHCKQLVFACSSIAKGI